jgi:hypothetical protein
VTDARWLDIREALASTTLHMGNAIALHRAGGFEGVSLEAYRARMAFMHAVQSGHTSLEGALLRVLDILGEERPTGERWHQDLIARACRPVEGTHARPAILSGELCAAIDETRRFRNLAVHGYDSFDAKKAQETVSAARLIADRLVDEIETFKHAVDGD